MKKQGKGSALPARISSRKKSNRSGYVQPFVQSVAIKDKPTQKNKETARRKKTLLDARVDRTISPAAIRTFRVSTTNPTLQQKKESISMQERLNNERLQEIRFKNFSRSLAVIFFGLLLFMQNAIVFFIVFWALETNKLSNLQPILAGLVAATLTETYFISKKIIDFVFSTTDYLDKKEDEINRQIKRANTSQKILQK